MPSSPTTRFFYQGDKLVTLAQPGDNRTIFRGNELPLAEQSPDNAEPAQLLGIDIQQSVLISTGKDDD
ncbi:hypothetical protein [Pseudomonas cremoricolorata]|uniref:Uncharacterized protein n=1 Tax=Pseudomonas cremoricolorata TaxID=157783 RepID=A0A089WQW9_9PSED|nr:hypothetical protein [Pseudomonas cremoricolorata]AIR90976.1 hypothetical protein LK03_17645 [Pseudomonas cremoricolorata]